MRIAGSSAERHQALRRILATKELSRQSEVVAALQEAGFEVTQSSVSRDMAQLGVRKVHGNYRLPPAEKDPILASIVSIAPAGGNILVIKTLTGAAQRIAYTIDANNFPFVAGTVAGDDTIFLATRSSTSQKRVIEWLGANI